MVEIKYEITTDLPVGKGSKFSLLNETFYFCQLWLNLMRISKVWHRIMKVIRKIRTLMW